MKDDLAGTVNKYPHIWSTRNTRPPESYAKNSREHVWFYCRECTATHERKAREVRLHPHRCSVCAGKIIITGINDAYSLLPTAMEQWDYNLNTVSPKTVGKSFKAYFQCKKCGVSTIRMASAVNTNPTSCVVCAGKQIVIGLNDLASQRPDLANQWHPHNDRTPEEVTLGSGYRALWQCTNKHAWEAEVGARAKLGNNCPYCAGQKAIPGHNDITAIPELHATWDHHRNEPDPREVTRGSNKPYWWTCPQGHSYQRTPNARTRKENNEYIIAPCPHCQKKKQSYGEIELLEFCKQFDPTIISGDRTILNGKEVDVFLPAHKIGLEFNGVYWHSDSMIQSKHGITAQEYHQRKVSEARQRNVTLLFIWNDDWANKKELMKVLITTAIVHNKIHPLLTKLKSQSPTATEKQQS